MEKKFISAVAYLHNNKNEIIPFMESVINTLDEYFENMELIAVDDACDDTTVALLKEYMDEHKCRFVVNVVHMGVYQGLEASMNAGRDTAIGDFVYEFDSINFDYDDKLPISVYEKSLEGYDIVTASGNAGQKITSKIFYNVYNRFSHGSGKIGAESFRLLSRRAINRIKSMGQHIPYRKAVYANCGLAMTTLKYESIKKIKRSGNTSERGTLALDAFIYFTNVLSRLSAVISAVFLLATIIVGIYIITDYFNVNKPVEGWVSSMAFMAFGFFGVFVLLTIILKYLSVLLNLQFRKQRYLVADIEKVVSK